MENALNKPATGPRTLLEFAGVASRPNRLSESVLVIVDAQREFTGGNLKLPDIAPALVEARKLLLRARSLGTPVVHVWHVNKPGAALFDPATEFVAPIESLQPEAGEIVVRKGFANAFYDSALAEELNKTGRRRLVVVGYMTHLAVDATVRSAVEHGFQTTVVGAACATRALADVDGETIPAAAIQRASLAMLRDRFACVIGASTELPD
ncbi:MAG: cysteine hydrolase [Acidobacteria bacterium]|nr:cysteine hydrolase [Acidobacteriota bacterium]